MALLVAHTTILKIPCHGSIMVLGVLSSFAIVLMRKRELVALLKLYSWCLVTFSVLWLFLVVLLIGLQSVIAVFPGHIKLHFQR